MISYGRQSIDSEDIKAVTSVLRSGHLTQGPWVSRFEEAFARYCGAPFAVAVSSGTAGLHLAALAGGFGKGDEVITTPLSFVATSNSLLYCGATPRFIDINCQTLGLDTDSVQRSIGIRTRGVVSVHFAGQPSPLKMNRAPGADRPLTHIEDACHALGAETEVSPGRWQKIGSCHASDMAVFSFHPVKHITTGEGGMVTTRRKDLYKKLLLLRSHGIERDPSKWQRKGQKNNSWYYEMTDLGCNYRLSDIQCALGFSQLKKIKHFLERRREIADFYNRKFRDLEYVKTPLAVSGTKHSYHLYVLRINYAKLNKSRAAVMAELRSKGVATQVHYIPIPSQPYYRKRTPYDPKRFANTERYYREALSIPMFPSLSRRQIDQVVSAVRKVCV